MKAKENLLLYFFIKKREGINPDIAIHTGFQSRQAIFNLSHNFFVYPSHYRS